MGIQSSEDSPAFPELEFLSKLIQLTNESSETICTFEFPVTFDERNVRALGLCMSNEPESVILQASHRAS